MKDRKTLSPSFNKPSQPRGRSLFPFDVVVVEDVQWAWSLKAD